MKSRNPSHRWVADRMGYTVPGVSMLRSGRRNPTLTTMRLIETSFGWPVTEQVKYAKADWTEAFNKMLQDKYEEVSK